MADLTVTPTKVGMIFPQMSRVYTYIAGVTITRGQCVYIDGAGQVVPTDASLAADAHPAGIALQDAGIGQAVDVLEYGYLNGFTVTGSDGDAPIYVSNTAGALSDTVGTVAVVIGRVRCMPDPGATKVLLIDVNNTQIPA